MGAAARRSCSYAWTAGRPLVCGPAEHDPATGSCLVQVRLARGPLRPPLRMRLQADHWSSSPPRTALELIPCGRVRPSAAYFRAGHLLLDWLTRSMARPGPTPAATRGRPALQSIRPDGVTLEAVGSLRSPPIAPPYRWIGEPRCLPAYREPRVFPSAEASTWC
jgi:hypothetical protein